MELGFEKSYETLNRQTNDGDICTALNRIYRQDCLESEYELPPELGRGCYRRIVPGRSADIAVCDFRFAREWTVAEKWRDCPFRISFCLAGEIEFSINGSKNLFKLQAAESFCYAGGGGSGVSRFPSGRRFYNITIAIAPSQFAGLGDCREFSRAVSDINNLGGNFRKYQITPGVERILTQLVNCPYPDGLKRIYLEGKILELAAVYLHETVGQRETASGVTGLSGEDIRCLHQARDILDRDYAAPPTLAVLAKMICLNEFKLKTGFKEIFGKPVYAYVIDKRMEVARLLLEERKARVGEAACLVGYTNISHFSAAFRKKFGINPGEYRGLKARSLF